MQAEAQPVRLSAILQGIYPLHERNDREVNDITLDSRQVQSGSLFMACPGAQHDARLYVDKAIAAGAAAVLVEADELQWCCEQVREGAPVLPILNLRQQMAELASRFFGEPGKTLRLIGVTGTNGKTSVSQLMAQAFQQLGYRCGVIGTLGHGLVSGPLAHDAAGPGTTPDAVQLQRILAGFRNAADTVVMEVSSHALDQGRVLINDFAVGVFTNLTRDHLDYHGAMEAYGAAKRVLFSGSGMDLAVLNYDDAFVRETETMLDASMRRFTWSTSDARADVYVRQMELHPDGVALVVHTPWAELAFTSKLLGSFNVSNVLAVLTTVLACESLTPAFDAQRVAKAIAGLEAVVGRMQVVGNFPVTVVVDYAHSPDALEKALQAVREHCKGKLWCVFGCGGDRDRGKRSMMAALAEQLADQIVLTDDNPRFEDSSVILADMLAGLQKPQHALVVPDRASAIAQTLTDANTGDVVLIAGKGHEDYQEVRGARAAFSDYAHALNALERRFGSLAAVREHRGAGA